MIKPSGSEYTAVYQQITQRDTQQHTPQGGTVGGDIERHLGIRLEKRNKGNSSEELKNCCRVADGGAQSAGVITF